MKTLRRVTALVGVIVLVALYVAALIFAVIGNENTMNLFWVAIVATVILPVLLWAYSFIYKLLKRDYSEEARAETKKMRDAMNKAQAASSEDPGEEESEE